MIKIKKSKEKIISLKLSSAKSKIIAALILCICLIFISNPKTYSNSALMAISVWAVSVLPVLLPFFIFSRIITELIPPKKSFLDKPFKKFYHTPDGSFLIFFLSVLSGYPMGAKLISNFYEKNYIDKRNATSMLSYCSISGPMFMVGTIGVSILLSFKAGLIIMISNILACLLNGFLYRNEKKDRTKSNENMKYNANLSDKHSSHLNNISNPNFELDNGNSATKRSNQDSGVSFSNILSDSVYDSLNSILIVGVYIMLSFLAIDLLKNLNILSNSANAICGVLHMASKQNVVESILSGLIEITRGNIDLSRTNISLQFKTIISSGLIGFGGLSVMLQSINFIKKLQIPFKTLFMQKLSQGIFATIIALLIALLCF